MGGAGGRGRRGRRDRGRGWPRALAAVARPRRRRRARADRPAPGRSGRRSTREKDRPAAECSTGEQKALILNLVLAQAARLSRAEFRSRILYCCWTKSPRTWTSSGAPALFDEIEALGLQAFLTGTDEALFDDLKGRAHGVRVDAGALTVTGLTE